MIYLSMNKLTVGKLIILLQKMPSESPVCFASWRGVHDLTEDDVKQDGCIYKNNEDGITRLVIDDCEATHGEFDNFSTPLDEGSK